MRRCSFSSSVLARFRGGRLVFGSGNSCPHDFLFLAALDVTTMRSGAGVSEDDLELSKRGGDDAACRSSIFKKL